MPAIGGGKDAFPYMLAVFDHLFGHNPMLGLIVNVTAGAMLIAVIAATTRMLGGNPRTGAWITALFPPMLLWGDLLLREAVVWLILGVTMWALVRLVSSLKDRLAWGTLVVALIVLLGFRGTATVIVAGAAILVLAFAQRRRWVTVGATVAVVVLGVVAIAVYGFARIDAARASLVTARTGSFPTASPSDPAGSLWAMLRIVPKVVLGPFPWEWVQVGVPFAFDAILWLAVIWFAFWGWKHSDDRRTLAAIIIPAAAILLALVVTSGNYGTMQRLRVEATVILLPLAAAGLRRHRISDKAAADRQPNAVR